MEYYVEENITLYSHILMVDEVTSLISQSMQYFLSQIMCLNYLMHDVSHLSNYQLCRYTIPC
jgi:hypothetical protein